MRTSIANPCGATEGARVRRPGAFRVDGALEVARVGGVRVKEHGSRITLNGEENLVRSEHVPVTRRESDASSGEERI